MNYFPIKDLKRAEYNPRIMPDSEMSALKTSIKTFGFVEPIVVNKNKDRYGVLVGGHQRLTALESLIASGTVPQGIIESDEKGIYLVPASFVDLSEEDEKLLNLARKTSGHQQSAQRRSPHPSFRI